MALPATNTGGNVWSPPSALSRTSGWFSKICTIPADVNNATYNGAWFTVPGFPGGPKMALKQANYANGNVVSVLNTVVTVKIKNYTNAKAAMASKTLVAADIVACAGTSVVTPALTLATTTTDRTAAFPVEATATEPDVNCFPGDILYVEIIADAGSTIRAGATVTGWFKAIDVDGA